MKTALVALIALGSTTLPAFADENQCHRLARHPNDPDMRFKGVAEESVDPDAAIKACEVAVQASPDDGRLQYQLGRAYIIGGNIQKGGPLITRAAELGYALAQYQVFEWSVQPNPPISLTDGEKATLIRNAAGAGLSDARLTLAFLHFQGKYVEKDAAKTVQLITDLANEGHPAGMYSYTELLEGGIIQGATIEDWLSWSKKTAKAGHPMSARKLAQYYAGQQNGTAALEWAKVGADTDDELAKSQYVGFLRNGVAGVKADRKKARLWLESRVAQGDSWAMMDLGFAYNTYPAQPEKALKYFTMAAEHGAYKAYWVTINMLEQQGKIESATPWLKKVVQEGPLQDRFKAAFKLASHMPSDGVRAFSAINSSGDMFNLRATIKAFEDQGGSYTWFEYRKYAERLIKTGTADDARHIATHLMAQLDGAEKALADKDNSLVTVPYDKYVREVRSYLDQIKPNLPEDLQAKIDGNKARYDQIVKKVMSHQGIANANASWARRYLERYEPSAALKKCGAKPESNTQSRWRACARREAASLRKSSSVIEGQIPYYRRTQAGYERHFYRDLLNDAADRLDSYIDTAG